MEHHLILDAGPLKQALHFLVLLHLIATIVSFDASSTCVQLLIKSKCPAAMLPN
jgi:hypothetical protein